MTVLYDLTNGKRKLGEHELAGYFDSLPAISRYIRMYIGQTPLASGTCFFVMSTDGSERPVGLFLQACACGHQSSTRSAVLGKRRYPYAHQTCSILRSLKWSVPA